MQVVGALIAAAVAVAYMAGGGIQGEAQRNLSQIEDQVAVDAVKQYQIAERQGDRMQICVQAGLVAAAYLQAKNEASYNQWKKIQAADCKRAGLPTY